jgi:hypothetical protein
MKTFKATVRVPSPSGYGVVTTWVQTQAANPIAAKSILEGQFGRGKVTSVPALVK